ncbi:autotransporter outer membrane beta-barrel domain-containing protein [Hoeflea sp. WL0058]|uniref:Autotransporter outer membrane beta-barrel domain-containing protein n=1 Tax=Flavimaribacter sediminis TaxID=2865987 RepID=A0AAE3D2V4_9HYPH|nr:autotransporter outer membrane beta-barrel domain-containing protein [Flavimaribacter sediminis]MBW8639216.1 autotransporter outer membrane beta-barrel domain-containing protein [Flavimaribacter sediminis]
MLATTALNVRPTAAQTTPPDAPCHQVSDGGATVTCTGDVSDGIILFNGAGPVTTLYVNSVTDDLVASSGISVISFVSEGDVTIISDTTDGPGGPFVISGATSAVMAITAQSTVSGDVTVNHTGDIVMENSGAIYATAADGSVSITHTGDASQSSADGVPLIFATASSDITITTVGDLARIGNGAVNLGGVSSGGSVSLNHTGSIDLIGNGGPSVFAVAANDVDIVIDGDVSMTGDGAPEIVARSTAGDVQITHTGLLTATGFNTTGIMATSEQGDVTVTRTGDLAMTVSGISDSTGFKVGGVWASSVEGDVTISQTGLVSMTGDGLFGLRAETENGSATILLDGDLTMDGLDTTGILAQAGGDGTILVTTYGAVMATGDGSTAISLVNEGSGDVMLQAMGDVSGAVNGVQIVTGTGDAFVEIAGLVTGSGGVAGDLTGVGGDGEASSRVTLMPGYGFDGIVDARNGYDRNRIVLGGDSGEAFFDLAELDDGDDVEEAGEVFFGFDPVLTKEGLSSFILTGVNADPFEEGVVEGGGLFLADGAVVAMDTGGSLSVSAGAVFGGYGVSSLMGDLINMGAVSLSDGSSLFASGMEGANDVLTISGDYYSDGGLLIMDAYLGASGSPADLLVIEGDVTGAGSTAVLVNNAGGPGGYTGPGGGIPLITVAGLTDAEDFYLAAPVTAGAFEYGLGLETDTWYLEAVSLTGIGVTAPYIPYALQNFGREITGSLSERLGGRTGFSPDLPGSFSFTANADLPGSDAPLAPEATEPAARYGAWARVLGAWSDADGSLLGGFGAGSYEETLWALQGGFDAVLVSEADSMLISSAFLHYGGSTTDSTDASSGLTVGSTSATGWGGGLGLTYATANGLYIDTVATYTRYDLDVAANGATGSTNADGVSVSGEAGWRIALSDRFGLTPQAQLVYQNIGIDGFIDSSAVATSFSNTDSLEGRVGLRMDLIGSGSTIPVLVYATADLVHQFLDDPVADINGTPLALGFDNSGYQLGAGLEFGGPATTLSSWINGSYRAPFDSDNGIATWDATAGVKVAF